MPTSLPGSPTPKPRRRLSPEARRAQLLDVSLATFAELGIERANHADVARRADVSTPTVFNYFASRPILVDVVLTEIERRLDRMLDTLTDLSDDPEKRILQTAAAYQGLVEEEPDVVKAFLKWGVSFDPDIRPRYLAYQDTVVERLRQILPKGSATPQSARLLYGYANMLATMMFDGVPLDELLGYAKRIATLMANPDQ